MIREIPLRRIPNQKVRTIINQQAIEIILLIGITIPSKVIYFFMTQQGASLIIIILG